jgi:DNA-binding transcriptional LysR family regulator
MMPVTGRSLERQLKVQLLERSGRGAKLTDAGSRLYEHASRSIEALLEAEQAVVSDQARLQGRLRLSLPQTFEPWWELLSAFQHRYPDIQVYVYSSNRRVDLIEDGIDVALRVGAIVHEAMIARRILSFRNVVVASPKLVKRFGLPEELPERTILTGRSLIAPYRFAIFLAGEAIRQSLPSSTAIGVRLGK